MTENSKGWDLSRDGCPNFYHGYLAAYVPKTEFDPKCTACQSRAAKKVQKT